MKRLVAAALLLSAGFAGPASAKTIWQGNMMLTAAGSACTSNGFDVGSFFTSDFRPANINNNGTASWLSFISSRSAQTYSVTGAFANGTYTGTSISSSAFATPSFTATFTKVSVKPAPTLTAQTLTLKATIANFFDISGCTVTVQGALYPRPDSPP